MKSKIESLGYNIESFEDEVIDLMRAATAGLARGAQAEWIRIAQERLSTSREMYVNGLRQAESFKTETLDGETAYTISLVGRMPNAIEQGMSSMDMKEVRPGWLGGGKAKTAKDGTKYTVIPFRHSTSSNARLNYSGKAAAMNLKKELRKTVRAYGLDRMKRTSSGRVVPGPVSRAPQRPPVHRYLRGLTRIQKPMATHTKTGKQRGSSQLMTWRVISEKSPPGSWVHPGLEPRNLLRDVEQWVDRESDNIIQKVLESA